jgi:hypothetical protein
LYRDQDVVSADGTSEYDTDGGPIHFAFDGYRKAALSVKTSIDEFLDLGDAGALMASSLFPAYLFLWRHHFEVVLKVSIALASKKVGPRRPSLFRGTAEDFRWELYTGRVLPETLRSPRIRTHSLLQLWNILEPITAWVVGDGGVRGAPVLSRVDVDAVAALLAELNALDPDGQGARYAYSTQGSVTLAGITSLDFDHTNANMERISLLLRGIALHVERSVRLRGEGAPLPSQSRLVILDDGRVMRAPSLPLKLGTRMVYKPMPGQESGAID